MHFINKIPKAIPGVLEEGDVQLWLKSEITTLTWGLKSIVAPPSGW